MALELTGLHHLTAITADAPGNRRFYTDTLGLRLVKKTVNQDDTSAYTCSMRTGWLRPVPTSPFSTGRYSANSAAPIASPAPACA
ncbi:hypothetical protein Q644_16390 [Brucella intermedia 229E]|uniref:Glyoxalase/fosfomycin resistance/dioxygenase domain-containing protein n=1 Tax=Brucella intermedia 229E TaxID=1337887 RepID=U4VDV7_9HYPH|nr:hypothetical protein Q644_16390 [Brucella intermedia 229E]